MKIAIIGMAGRFPGAENLEMFWENLCAGNDTITRDNSTVQREGYVKIGAFGSIAGAYRFDASYFGMSEREALETDPQERLLMTLAVHALEDAGVVLDEEHNNVGMICGAKENEYALRRYYQTDLTGVERETAKVYLGASLATRTAYKLNMQGPVMQIRATCATGLAAAHLACGMLRNGEADVMLAGAVNLSQQNQYYVYMDGGITSRDGHGRAFSEEASGCVPGDGAAVVVLKRYEDALRDHNQIYAVIRGSALHNDGNIKMGFSAPSRVAEQRTIQDALQSAGISPEQVDFVETHGTATRLGDMVELGALQRIFSPEQALLLGAVKNNIGHSNYAAGMAGLVKTALVLANGTVPPVVNSTTTSEAVLANGFVLNREPVRLAGRHPERPLTAGVSSFGIGGNNVHMILEEAGLPDQEQKNQREMLFFLSAKTPESLRAYESAFANWLKINPDKWLSAVFTLCAGRRAMSCRSILHAVLQENGSVTIQSYIPEEVPAGQTVTLTGYTMEDLKQVAGVYLAGGTVLPCAIPETSSLRMISLPGYCFAETEYNLFADMPEDSENPENTENSEQSEHRADTPQEAITAIIREVTGCEFKPEDDIDAIGLDSLTFVIICSKIEAKYQVNLSSLDLFAYDSVGELIEEMETAVHVASPAIQEETPVTDQAQDIGDLLDQILA